VKPRFFSYFQIVSEVAAYLRVSKKWWLGPILVVLLVFGMFIVAVETSTLLPFFYALF
jgi:hypothetical protein